MSKCVGIVLNSYWSVELIYAQDLITKLVTPQSCHTYGHDKYSVSFIGYMLMISSKDINTETEQRESACLIVGNRSY